MAYTTLLLGAIGVLAETSDMQRRAFNTAFEQHDLDWHWDSETYAALLEVPGGKARLNYYAQGQGTTIDIDAVYESKLEAFDAALRNGVPLRPGIGDIIAAAQARGMKIGFATGTDPRQVDAILSAVSDQIDRSVFDFIGNNTKAANPKPAPDIYDAALAALGAAPNEAVAIEDTPESAAAAVAAGIITYGYAGAESKTRAFGPRVTVLRDAPDAALLHQGTKAA